MKKAFNKFIQWDKNKIEWAKKKWNLSDYQITCISFAKGFIIGAILL